MIFKVMETAHGRKNSDPRTIRHIVFKRLYCHVGCNGLSKRQHWSIENNLHWQLDVTFDENKLRMRIKNAAQNLSIMRRMTLNILKLDNLKDSLKGKRKRAGWSKSYFDKLLEFLAKF